MKKYNIVIILVGLAFLFSCAKKEKVAPDLNDISGPIVLGDAFSVSKSTPSFKNNELVYFAGTFVDEAYWVLTIKGKTSGATKTFEGTGTSIKNATWDGTADDLPSFRVEAVTATLSFPKASSVTSALPLTLAMSILGAKNLNYGHVLVTDFKTGKYAGAGASSDLFWPSDWPATASLDNIPFINPDGNQYCTMGPAAPWQPNLDFVGHISPYVDFLTISAKSLGYPTYFPLIADYSKIYFNMMVYNSVLPTNTWLNVTIFEEDPAITGVINAKTITIKPTWNTGWKQLTFDYDVFKLSDSTKVIRNPQKIRMVQLVLLSSAPQAVLDAGKTQVSASFDHLIFTHYKPYQP